jgi:hypothetical protein
VRGQDVRGVIDRFEGEDAVLVLDDGQSVNWPRCALAPGAAQGTAVWLTLSFEGSPVDGGRARADVSPSPSGAAARLPARANRDAQTGQWVLTLPDGSDLRWPADAEVAAQAAVAVTLELTPDAADTAARRRRVTGLLDDVFGGPASGE